MEEVNVISNLRQLVKGIDTETPSDTLFTSTDLYIINSLGSAAIANVVFYKFFKNVIPKQCVLFYGDFVPSYDFADKTSNYYDCPKRKLTVYDELYPIGFSKYFKIFDDGALVISQNTSDLNASYCGNGDINDVVKFLFEITEEIVDDKKEGKIEYRLVQAGCGGFTTQTFEMDDMEIDISRNYNDDFDYEKMKNLQLSDNPSLTLLHGKPGTGKTTILKQLIKDISGQRGVFYMDCNLLSSFSNGSFMDFVMRNLKGNVLILEDCEKALMDRGAGNNQIITTILNMTDGFLAASIKPHFICTFNCSLSKIDKALLRKGRLSFRYEFGDLSLEKCKAINPLADKPMPLSELYNLEEVVCVQTSSSRIGF